MATTPQDRDEQPASPVTDYERTGEDTVGEGDYLRVRRVHLRNVRADGTRSRPYFCEFVDRPRHGTDAVVVALWRRAADAPPGELEVLLRRGLRPALRFGRPADRLALPDARPYLFLTEVVAGILEDEDTGEAGVRRRAALEVWEEAGYRVADADIEFLGHRVFPTPGMAPESFYLCAVRIAPDAPAAPPEGDGSPMEEGSEQRWVPLPEALARCDRGEIEDAKTELCLRRLAARHG